MKKMFRVLSVSFSLVALFTTMTFPGGSITFNSPTQGQIITHIGDRSTIPVNILYGFTLDPNYSIPSYQKLYAPPYGTFQTDQENSLPQWLYPTAGTYQWRIELWQWTALGQPIKTAEQTVSFTVKYVLNVMNCFTGGNIKIDNVQNSSPVTVQKLINDNISATAMEPQSYNNYIWIWNTSLVVTSDWSRKKYNDAESHLLGTNNININYGVQSDDNGAQLIANLKKQLTITVQNSFVGGGNGGTIIVNGAQDNSPADTTIIEQNPLPVSAQDQTIYGIDYVFSGWYDGPASNANLISSARSHDFYPGGNTTYYAHFIGYPNVNSMNVQSNSGTEGAKPTLTWTDNVNTNVSYKIYKSTKDGGIWSDWSFLTNVNKGPGHYTDGEYYQPGGKNLNLTLRVDAYYSIESTSHVGGGTEFTVDWYINPNKRNFGNNETAAITEYKLYDNFPNPFNPSTEIYYQLPSDGNVKLRVYNLMGQEVMTLVNEFKEKGMYNVTFNAGRLASGMYIYKLEAGSFIQVKKMLLTK